MHHATAATVALTGATGFIGGVLARTLAANGWPVRALARPRRRRPHAAGVGEWVHGTLEDADALQRLLQGVTAVVHCAGAVRGARPADFERVNAGGTACLLAAVQRLGVAPRFLLVSSLAAREPALSPYAASKRQAETLLGQAGAGLHWAALRPPAVYGPGDREILPLLRLMRRGFAPVPGDPAARLSLLYVDDLARAVLAWLAQPAAPCAVYELHDGQPGGYTWSQLSAIAAGVHGRPVRCVPLPRALLEVTAAVNLFGARRLGYAPMFTPWKLRELWHPHWVCDNAALSGAIGWQPQVSFEQGLRLTLATATLSGS